MARKSTKNVRHGRPSKAAKALKAVQEALPSNTKLTPAQRMEKILAQKDASMVAKYPHYVQGSVRLSTPEDLGGKAKKFVALIKCQCGNTRLVSTSDVFQVRQCLRCHSGVADDIVALREKLAQAEAKEAALTSTVAA